MTEARSEARQAARGERLAGKAAIVTGAARGIGGAVAVAFAREGADVMGIDIAGPVSATLEVAAATRDELAETGRLVEAAGRRWCEATLDQRDLSALRAAAATARSRFGRLDILFATAGIQSFKPILEWDDADWHDQIDVNLTGHLQCHPRRGAAFGCEWRRTHHCHVVGAGAARHQIWRRLFGVQMGHHRADEVGGAGIRRAQDHPQRAHTRSDRHASHPASDAL